jgi:hypothetical protein
MQLSDEQVINAVEVAARVFADAITTLIDQNKLAADT